MEHIQNAFETLHGKSAQIYFAIVRTQVSFAKFSENGDTYLTSDLLKMFSLIKRSS